MNQTRGFCTGLLLLLLVATGCAGSGEGQVVPTIDPGPMAGSVVTNQTRTHLWGCYDVILDLENQTVEAVLKRSVMFTANVVTFLNTNPSGLTFHINKTVPGPDFTEVDIDITISHPFPGLPEYNGYDVRGVFMGDGSIAMAHDNSLICPDLSADQCMLTDPDDGYGGPDGYTRWFNPAEFSMGGLALFSYTPGALATPGFSGTATVNPYKYFADGLSATGNLYTWLNEHTSQHGRFSSGSSNRRNYCLRFPDDKGVTYGYAVIANWEGEGLQHHPSNAPEALACDVLDESDMWYVDPVHNGGNLILEASLFGWGDQPTAIFIESTVLGSVYEFSTSDMIPIASGDNFRTYRVEIPADGLTGCWGNELWVIAEYGDLDYSNDFGVPNQTGGDPLAAFFRYPAEVSDEAPGVIQVLVPNGGEEWEIGSTHEITWDSENVTGTVFIEYSRSNFQYSVFSIATDEADDGSFMWINIPDTPSPTARVRISSTDFPSVNDTSDGDFKIYSSDCTNEPFEELADGNESCADPGEFGWQYIPPYEEFWWDVNCYDPASGDPPPELPTDPDPIQGGVIDHIGIQLDDRPTTGYAIDINEICTSSCDVFIDYTEYVPGPGVDVEPITTNPWIVVAVEVPPVFCYWTWHFERHEEIY